MSTFKCYYLNASKIFSLRTRPATPGRPNFFNVEFKIAENVTKHLDPRGSGIYAIFFDEMLIYVGSFLGQASDNGGGNIIKTRWDKHLGTISMRGHKVSIGPRAFEKLEKSRLESELLHSLSKYSSDSLALHRGCVSSVNRVSFAADNWATFESFNNSTLERFSFLYVRCMNLPVKSSEFKKRILEVEKGAIAWLKPRCNKEIPSGLHLSKVTVKTAKEKILTDLMDDLDVSFRKAA
ncbi:hypothetical protein [Bdellovibrio sp.]|uniref:hypothetical protein n=1 Tax=Bdellovibrio sp. TaxID=28201 RepID=UPI0039E53E90